MKHNVKRFFTFLSFLALGLGAMSSCANNLPNDGQLDGNNIPDIPEVNHDEKEETLVKPVSGFIKGDEDRKNLEKEQVYSETGELLIPFDEAYPEFMNQTFYDENSILVKARNTEVRGVYDKLSSRGVKDYEFVSRATKDVSWYKFNLEGVKSNEVIKDFRNSNTKAMLFDLNYVLDKESLCTVESTPVEVTTPTVPDATIDDCNIPNAESNVHFKDQYYFKGYGLKEGYKYLKDNAIPEAGDGVVVAVIDTGVKLRHKDLRDNIWTNPIEVPNNNIDDDGNGYVDDVHGWNFVDRNKNPNDDQGHGTHVAGIIAAKNNNIGVVGVAYNAKIMALKAGDYAGNFTSSNIARAIEYAYINGADIINMSFGGATISKAEQDALKAASDTACLVAAAGNDGNANEFYSGMDDDDIDVLPTYPATLNYVLGVMSVDKDNTESAFTNIDGTKNTTNEYEVYAPGVEVYSTFPDDDDDDDDDDDEDDYEVLSGTSMSAPVVSGMLAILRARFADTKTYDSKFLMGQLVSTANIPVKCCDPDDHGSHNIPNAVNLYEALFVDAKPELSLLDYRFFDLKTLGRNNNQDYNLDIGETGYLAPVLRNKWGNARNVKIEFSLDTSSNTEISKYVTLENTVINFNEIGAYTTKDYMILNADNNAFVGCDTNNSLKIVIADTIPGNLDFAINYTITSNNALAMEDVNEYTTPSAINLKVNCGVHLQKIIDTDLTLSSNKHYIVSDTVFIEPNATVTVESGTEIEFVEDPGDSYGGETTYGNIEVRGKFNLIGTEKEMIKIYSSNKNILSDDYYIHSYKGCFINLVYCDMFNINLNSGTNDNGRYAFTINHCKICSKNFENIFSVRNSYLECINYYNLLDSKCNTIIYDNYYSRSFFEINSGHYNKIIVTSNGSDPLIIDPCSNILGDMFYVNYDTNYFHSYSNTFDKYYDSIFNPLLAENFARVELILKKHNVTSLWYKSLRDILDIIFGKTESYISNNASISFYIVVQNNKVFDALGNEIIPSDYSIDNYEKTDFFNQLEAIDKSKNSMYHFECKKNYIGNIYEFGSNTPYYFRSECAINLEQTILAYNDIQFGNKYNNISGDLKNIHFETKVEDIITSPHTYENNLNLNTNDTTYLDKISKDGRDDPHRAIIGFVNTEDKENEKLWPYVAKCEFINHDGQAADTFGSGTMKTRLTFNRDMDVTDPLKVTFGPKAHSYVDNTYDNYEIAGNFISPRVWEGTFKISSMMENGRHYLAISGSRAADDHFLTLEEVKGRFTFSVDTTTAMAQTIKGHALDTGIQLDLAQDDYALSTFMGYNIYRSDDKDGNYSRINKKVINKNSCTYLDTNVTPGKTYWYTFTIVLSDFSETAPAAKISVRAKDTMAPSIYHEAVYQAYTGQNLPIKCKISDNIGVTEAKLYYRTTGTTDYKVISMRNVNSVYSALIPSSDVTVAGIDYYIEATDGTNYVKSGSEIDPYQIFIKENAVLNNIGDVDGDSSITVKDAYMILRHISGELLLQDDQFRRADLNNNKRLETVEALRILQYINGKVSSLDMTNLA